MARWIYEAGIGENRAILVERGAILEAVIELPETLRVGSIVDGRLARILVPARRGLVALDTGEAYLDPLPAELTEGQAIRVEIVREPIAESDLVKRAKVRLSDGPCTSGPALLDRLRGMSLPVEMAGRDVGDSFESHGWSELLEEAETGVIPFDGGTLRVALTPAMTLFDVDGFLVPAALAIAGASAAGLAIRRHGIAGSIGIDLPTLASKADRQAAARALDAALPQPFERTAVNGFGFLQLIRRRERASLPELLQIDRVGSAARALLRRAERTGGAGERRITAAPAVIQMIREEWRIELERRIGAHVALRPDAALAISAGHVQSAHP